GAGAAGYARRTGHARRAERFPHLAAEAGPTVRLAAEGEVGQELEGDVAHDVAAGPGHRCAQPRLARPTGEERDHRSHDEARPMLEEPIERIFPGGPRVARLRGRGAHL